MIVTEKNINAVHYIVSRFASNGNDLTIVYTSKEIEDELKDLIESEIKKVTNLFTAFNNIGIKLWKKSKKFKRSAVYDPYGRRIFEISKEEKIVVVIQWE